MPLSTAMLLLFAPAPTSGPVIHRCVDAESAVTYQQTPCPAGVEAESVAIRPQDIRPAAPPPNAPAPETGAPPPASPAPLAEPASSWLCLAADGVRFYRHDGCPTQLSVRQPYVWVGETPISAPVFVPVRALAIERDSACAAIYDRGAGRRSGSEHDQRYTIYERATGRDPCR